VAVRETEERRDHWPAPGLDLPVGRLKKDGGFEDVLGYLIGRNALWFAVGVPLAVFAHGGFAAAGYLIVTAGFLATGVGIATAVLLRNGRPYSGWRLVAVALVVSVIPVVFLWPSGPVQHFAGIRPPAWLDALMAGLAPLVAAFLVDRRSRGIACLRLSPPPEGDAASVAWLDRRITYLESLLRARRVFAPERLDVVRALGHTRLTRFRQASSGQVADLHRAIGYFRQAAEQTPPGAPDEPAVYYDLAHALFRCAVLEMRGEDMVEAMTLLRRICLSDLGEKLPAKDRDTARRELYDLTWVSSRLLGAPDEDSRTEALRELTAMAAEDRPDSERGQILVIMAEFHLLWTYAETRGPRVEAEDMLVHLDQAVDAARTADSLITPADGDTTYVWSTLAFLLAQRLRLRILLQVAGDDDLDDHEEAKRYLRLAMSDPAILRPEPVAEISGALARALKATSLCMDVDLQLGRWQEVIAIGRPGLDALGTIVGSAIFRHSREESLLVGKGLAGKLGYAVAMAGGLRPEALLEVVRLTESGRAVLLRESLGRSELAEQADRLAGADHADLAAQARAMLSRVAGLEALELSSHDAEGRAVRRLDDRAGVPLRDSIGNAHADIVRLRARIGEALGAEGDDAQTLERAVADAASAAPLCYLLHIPNGDDNARPDLPGLAIIVRSGQELSMRAVQLPDVTGETVRGWRERWERAHGNGTLRTGDLIALTGLFREIGERLIEPVYTAAGRPERLVLLPDGPLSMLPLHVAPVKDEAGVPRPLCTQAVVIYAPTAVVLRSCQARAAEMGTALPTRFAGVADPGAELRGASPELRAAAGFFAAAEIISDDATPRRVMDAVGADAATGTPWVVHFACHARAEIGDPLSGYFQLAPGPEGRLRLADLLGAGLAHARAAVLSACETGTLGSADPDQYVSLAAGFIQIGAAGVIGTLSPVADPVALIVTRRFYEAWAGRPADPAEALSDAQRWLATADAAAIRAVLADVYPEIGPLDAARYGHPGHWAPFFFLGA
jgi:hypothetical protein